MKSLVCFKPCDPFRRKSKEIDQRIASWTNNFNSSFKLLLLGPAGAGKTTILKQMKIIHFEGFSQEERMQKAKEIRTNLLESVRELTSSILASGNRISWADAENQHRLDFINNINLDDSTYELYAAKIYDYAKRILTDKGVEEHFAKVNQISITCRSKYLLTRVNEIRNSKYVPSNDDILRSRRKTSDIQKIEFQVKPPRKYGNEPQTFWMFDVGGQRGERRKWIQVFDGISAVMFLIDCSSFDAVDDENGNNRLRETMSLFYEVWTTRFLRNSNFVLLFNKQDILRSKIERGHRVEDHFPEYATYRPSAQDASIDCPDYEYIKARSFIRDKFLAITRQGLCDPSAARKFSSPNLLHANRQHKSHSISHSFFTARHNLNNATNGSNGSNNNNQTNNNNYQNINNNTANHQSAPTTPVRAPPLSASKRANSQRAPDYIGYDRSNYAKSAANQQAPPVGQYSSSSLVSAQSSDQPRRTICYHYTTATDTENIRCLFEELQIMVIKSSLKSSNR